MSHLQTSHSFPKEETIDVESSDVKGTTDWHKSAEKESDAQISMSANLSASIEKTSDALQVSMEPCKTPRCLQEPATAVEQLSTPNEAPRGPTLFGRRSQHRQSYVDRDTTLLHIRNKSKPEDFEPKWCLPSPKELKWNALYGKSQAQVLGSTTCKRSGPASPRSQRRDRPRADPTSETRAAGLKQPPNSENLPDNVSVLAETTFSEAVYPLNKMLIGRDQGSRCSPRRPRWRHTTSDSLFEPEGSLQQLPTEGDQRTQSTSVTSASEIRKRFERRSLQLNPLKWQSSPVIPSVTPIPNNGTDISHSPAFSYAHGVSRPDALQQDFNEKLSKLRESQPSFSDIFGTYISRMRPEKPTITVTRTTTASGESTIDEASNHVCNNADFDLPPSAKPNRLMCEVRAELLSGALGSRKSSEAMSAVNVEGFSARDRYQKEFNGSSHQIFSKENGFDRHSRTHSRETSPARSVADLLGAPKKHSRPQARVLLLRLGNIPQNLTSELLTAELQRRRCRVTQAWFPLDILSGEHRGVGSLVVRTSWVEAEEDPLESAVDWLRDELKIRVEFEELRRERAGSKTLANVTYKSTRGGISGVSFDRAVLEGLAPDGGLYVPEIIPRVNAETRREWGTLKYRDLFAAIIRLFVGHSILPENVLGDIVEKAFSSFRVPECAACEPLRPPDALYVDKPTVNTASAENLYFLELYHGPTFAFKDFALQFLARLLSYFEQGRRCATDQLAAGGSEKEPLLILGATSGDTGSAAIAAFRNVPSVKCAVLFPKGRTSLIQELQMTTVLDSNIQSIAIRDACFDDCQAFVKAIFSMPRDLHGLRLSAANSINWARILAQITYYWWAALRNYAQSNVVQKENIPQSGSLIDVCVPTGNFGNILAAYYARKMGAPIRNLIIASNSNDILTRAYLSGIYAPREVVPTMSPSMDIQMSSNFERLIYHLSEDDAEVIKVCFENHLKKFKQFVFPDEVRNRFQNEFYAVKATEKETIETIRDVFYTLSGNSARRILDPHTAVAMFAALQYRSSNPSSNPSSNSSSNPSSNLSSNPSSNSSSNSSSLSSVTSTPLVVVSTAHFAKFPDAIRAALPEDFGDIVLPIELTQLNDFPTKKLELPPDVNEIVKHLQAFVANM